MHTKDARRRLLVKDEDGIAVAIAAELCQFSYTVKPNVTYIDGKPQSDSDGYHVTVEAEGPRAIAELIAAAEGDGSEAAAGMTNLLNRTVDLWQQWNAGKAVESES